MILTLQEHILSYSMYSCITYIFLYVCLLIFMYCIYVLRFLLLEEEKRAICIITENYQFTSSCTLNYQGSYRNQHCWLKNKKSADVRFKIKRLIIASDVSARVIDNELEKVQRSNYVQ